MASKLSTLIKAGGLAYGALSAAYTASRLRAAVSDMSRTPAPTRPAYRSRTYRRGRYSRRMIARVPRRVYDDGYRKFVRCTNQFGTIGPIAAGTSVFGAASPVLTSIQTADLVAMYRYYRIDKIVVYLVPRVDPANSGLASNFTCMVAMCCDPEDITAPASTQAVTAYDNSYQKFLTSNSAPFKYTFYPKVVNAVGNAGVAAFVGGYGRNPWLNLSAAGILIPHNCLKWAITCGANSTITFDAYFEYHISVKGVA